MQEVRELVEAAKAAQRELAQMSQAQVDRIVRAIADAGVRNAELEFGRPVKIGSSVWIGGNTVVNPGVTIGDDVVIGSGSVVTKDIPSHVIAAGNPCRVLRPIREDDRLYWEAQAAQYGRDRQG